MEIRATREASVITDGPVQCGQVLPHLLAAFPEGLLIPGLDLEEHQARDVRDIRAYLTLVRAQTGQVSKAHTVNYDFD
ncbi:hypothetical protein [Archangium lansingense]|uniref:Uncharacterized protein n=1 Tax=Archangium lansingense TaxID=2995310 RepID=A0ABT3ZZQ7_9BACT|nr:hypothetical protein [Archangium lansinium]MCY1074878.1 hypothetical protein [Archangium lansinium]